jgi:hypothetical protein
MKEYAFTASNDKGEFYSLKLFTPKELSKEVFDSILKEIIELSQKYK